jgi:hypothetical protein
MKHAIEIASCGMTYLPDFMKIDIGFQWILILINWYSGGWSPIGSTRHCGHQ